MSESDDFEDLLNSNNLLNGGSTNQCGEDKLYSAQQKAPLYEENLNVPLKRVDPARCKPWKYHNRDIAWLTKELCQDLMHSIKKYGQMDPALVRKIQDDPHYDHEIIYGVRRWYVCSQTPNQKLLVRVIDEDDKTCMLLMHTENADSKDISEFERAFSFAQQMGSGVFKNQTEMANAVGLKQGTVSKMIKAASIFEQDWIARLFPNKLDIQIKKSYILSTLLKIPRTFGSIRKEADLIWDEQKTLGYMISSSDVLKRLIAAAKPELPPQDNIFKTPIVSSRQDQEGKIHIVIENIGKNMNLSTVEAICIKAIKAFSNSLFPEK